MSSSTVALPNGVAAAPAPAHDDDDCSAEAVHQHHMAACAVSSNLKRKRSSSSADIPDFTQNTIPFPSVVKTSSTLATTPQLLQPLTLVKNEFQSDARILSRSGSSLWEQGTMRVSQEQKLSPVAAGVVSEKSALWGFYAGEASDATVSAANSPFLSLSTVPGEV